MVEGMEKKEQGSSPSHCGPETLTSHQPLPSQVTLQLGWSTGMACLPLTAKPVAAQSACTVPIVSLTCQLMPGQVIDLAPRPWRLSASPPLLSSSLLSCVLLPIRHMIVAEFCCYVTGKGLQMKLLDSPIYPWLLKAFCLAARQISVKAPFPSRNLFCSWDVGDLGGCLVLT